VVTGPQIDYAAVYRQLPIPVVLLTPEFLKADANLAFLHTTGRTREQVLGRNVFDAFQNNPSDPAATGMSDVSASLHRVLATGEPDARALQKYDVEVPGSPGEFAAHYWDPVSGRSSALMAAWS
jgi:PAS domain-containing protein